jgi:hypothetical protein
MGRVSTVTTSMAARVTILVNVIVAATVLGSVIARSRQGPPLRAMDEATLRGYTGVYEWGKNAYVYLQLWSGARLTV